MSLNVWTFTGRLGRDAEQKYLPNGTAVTEFSVAVDVGGLPATRRTTRWRCACFWRPWRKGCAIPAKRPASRR
ncbi:MAG: single-stranded DNA-binding protein [Sulfuritalea sp.]|nr:single-stranded DNA-binding protein [Sulfuritalea sp.]